MKNTVKIKGVTYKIGEGGQVVAITDQKSGRFDPPHSNETIQRLSEAYRDEKATKAKSQVNAK